MGRRGLIATSARVAQDCATQAGLVHERRAFRIPSTSPTCALKPLVLLSSRDLSEALTHRSPSDQDVAAAIVSSCESSGPRRSCRWVRREGRSLLEVEYRLPPPKLRYWPGPNGVQLALLSVEAPREKPSLRRRARASVELQGLSAGPRIPRPHDELWLVHHPPASLRGASVAELDHFFSAILPTWSSSPLKPLFTKHQVLVLRAARVRELHLLERLRLFPKSEQTKWFSAFQQHRASLSGSTIEASLDPEASAYAAQRSLRQAALRKASMGPTGPNGAGDARISRGWVSTSSVGYFELRIDAGYRATGSPVLDRAGRVVGVVDKVGPSAALGLFGFRKDSAVRVVPLYKAARALNELEAPELARTLQY